MDGNGEAKTDPKAEAENQLERLRLRLKEALKAEDYELAAACRDQIKALREEVERHDEMV